MWFRYSKEQKGKRDKSFFHSCASDCQSLPCASQVTSFLCSFLETTVHMQEMHNHIYTQIYLYLFMNSLLCMWIVEYYALFFFHLVYLSNHSKSVPKGLFFMLLDIIQGCRCTVICVIGLLLMNIYIIPSYFCYNQYYIESPNICVTCAFICTRNFLK